MGALNDGYQNKNPSKLISTKELNGDKKIWKTKTRETPVTPPAVRNNVSHDWD